MTSTKERIERAEEELRLAKEELSKSQLSREAQAIYDGFSQYKECKITTDQFSNGSPHGSPYGLHVIVDTQRGWTGCLNVFENLLDDHGLYVGNFSTSDDGNVILYFFKR